MEQVGKYQLVRKLATGGMAEVFLAKASGPMGFEKTLVLKRILPHLAQETAFVQMFLTEAKLAARLSHSNIAQIFDFGEVEGEYFLAMEYVDGPSLRTVIKRAGALGQSLPPALCARLVGHACEGLAFAHDFADPETGKPLHLIHRDISPDNILLSRQGEVKVVDFGIAKAAGHGQNTEFGTIKGKLSYMSPEQARARPLDRRADVYALGVVFFELLTGRKPFESNSDAGLMQNVLQKPPTRLATLRPELPDTLQLIIDRSLAKERDQRYPDCHALQADLEDFILSEGRSVTMQHVAQFIHHIAQGTEYTFPVGTPRSKPSFSSLPASVPAEPPKHVPTVASSPRAREPARNVPSDPSLPPPFEPTAVTMQAPVSQVTVPHLVSEPEPTPVLGQASAVSQVSQVSAVSRLFSRGRARWAVAAFAGCTVLAAAGIYFGADSTPVPVAVSPPRPPTSVTDGSRPVIAPPPPVVAAPPPPVQEPLAQASPAEEILEEPVEEEPATAVAPAGKSARPRRPASSKGATTGFVEFRVWPYATVFVNGENLGVTPIARKELPVGNHEVKLVNQKLNKTVTRSIKIKPERSTVVKINLVED